MRLPFFGRPAALARILLVDDDPSILETTEFVLKKEGFEVRTAKNGEEGLKVLETYEADVVIADIMMPKKNGLEMLAEIRRNPIWRKKAVMLLTARRQSEDVLQGYTAGADCYLTKPFQKDQLISSVKSILAAVQEERDEKGRMRRIVDQ
ncbi:MAG: response regulator [Planctomycetota bacterium]